MLTDYIRPKPPGIVRRSKFYNRLRKNVLSYVAELCALAEHCNFSGTFDVMIRDRYVGYYAQIQIDPSAMTKFCKARTVPYIMLTEH